MISTGRLKNESPPAYEAWRCYLELGQGRTMAEVSKKLAKSERLIRRWGFTHKWQERLIVWHHEEEQRQIDAKAQAALEAARLVQKRRQQVADRAWDMAQKLFEKAQAMLAFPVSHQEKKTETKTADGKTTNIDWTIIEPANWNFGTTSKLIEVSDALARLSLGMPQKVTALTDKDGGSLPSGSAPPIQLVVNVTREPDDPVSNLITNVTNAPSATGNGERSYERP